MATFKTMSDANLPLQLTLFVGNSLKVKVIPAPGERTPFKLTITPEKSVVLVKDDIRAAANFEIFTLKAQAPGFVRFEAQNAAGAKAGPISVTVKQPIALPSNSADQLAMIKLLLAESVSPYSAAYSAADSKVGMQWMRLVLQNRLNIKSASVASKDAKSLIDVIKSQGQFKGFENYPKIDKGPQDLIDEILKIANDGAHPKQQVFYSHVSAAITVASELLITDPCSTKLLGWRTAGSSAPGGDFKLYKTFAGQDFYTVAK